MGSQVDLRKLGKFVNASGGPCSSFEAPTRCSRRTRGNVTWEHKPNSVATSRVKVWADTDPEPATWDASRSTVGDNYVGQRDGFSMWANNPSGSRSLSFDYIDFATGAVAMWRVSDPPDAATGATPVDHEISTYGERANLHHQARVPRVRRLSRMVAGLTICLAIVTACTDPGLGAAIMVENRTDVTLHFGLVMTNGREFPLTDEVPAGDKFVLLAGSQLSEDAGMLVDACTVGDLSAYGPDGSEVARHPPPLCAMTVPTWVIQPSEGPSP
jgi:hypothetical protein